MIRLALMGDSIAWGVGATREDDRLAGRLTRGLAQHDVTASTRVVAVPGARSAGLAAQVDGVLPWRPDVCVLVIGANDLTHLVPVAQAVADLDAAIGRLRRSGSEVVLAPAPDLSTVPHVPPAFRALVQAASVDLRRRQEEVATRLGARVADADGTSAADFRADTSLFAADRFHPSSAGYAVIAEALLPAVVAAALAGRQG